MLHNNIFLVSMPNTETSRHFGLHTNVDIDSIYNFLRAYQNSRALFIMQ